MRSSAVRASKRLCTGLGTGSSLQHNRHVIVPPLARSFAPRHDRTQSRRALSYTPQCFGIPPPPVSADLDSFVHTDANTPENLARLQALPLHCSGCGAPSQIVAPEEAGFYTLTRQGLRRFIHDKTHSTGEEAAAEDASPICDRCHKLLHHSVGNPIFHPSIDSINEIIASSPYKHNTIYHILDAADLPMSLIPSLQQDLRLPRLRTQNRRSKHTFFSQGRIAEVFFIITRADLLAPKKEQVDSLLPYIRELLRDALGRTGKNVRLGNVKCVSAQRGWWTKTVKDEIWSRGGAGWMVGKVNVGKSSLFKVVFPKGRGAVKAHSDEDAGILALRQAQRLDAQAAGRPVKAEEDDDDDFDELDDPHMPQEGSPLLPPPRPEQPYPAMPIASALPGTTASPIRLPFGAGKGELIDLPGVARSTLEKHVPPTLRPDLLMHSRLSPDQIVIKPAQSLLLGGGLVRLTNPSKTDVLLAYPFVPVPVHLTSTVKAEGLARGDRDLAIPSLLEPASRSTLASAGRLRLEWDVTKARAGPLTRKDAVGLKAERLPFVVWSADVVIEGVGWVELVAQRRRREWEAARRATSSRSRDGNHPFTEEAGRDPVQDAVQEPAVPGVFPEVEVFSPEGKYVAVRRPMGAWLLAQKVKRKAPAPGARQRRSMRSVKMSDRGRARIAAQEKEV